MGEKQTIYKRREVGEKKKIDQSYCTNIGHSQYVDFEYPKKERNKLCTERQTLNRSTKSIEVDDRNIVSALPNEISQKLSACVETTEHLVSATNLCKHGGTFYARDNFLSLSHTRSPDGGNASPCSSRGLKKPRDADCKHIYTNS